MLRLSAHLARSGADVAICCSGGELLDQLDPCVNQLLYSKVDEAPEKCRDWLRASSEPVALISYDPISAGIGLLIEARCATLSSFNHISGVLHPRAWFMDTERADRVKLNQIVASAVGYDQFFFMNEECRSEHQKRWRVNLSECPIIPVAVPAWDRTWNKTAGKRLKVVSVGRLVDFKQYNVGIPAIVRQALDIGIPIDWDIYGTGPLHDEVAEQITSHSVSAEVRLNGHLPYSDFATTVLGYDVFVGLGTAALEAAMLGIPVVTATDMERFKSYGYLDELPFANLGERQGAPPPAYILDLLQQVHVLDAAGRQELSSRMHDVAKRYSVSDVASQMRHLAAAGLPGPPISRKRVVAWLYLAMTQGTAPRLARLLRDQSRELLKRARP
jgi:hypothetical protein